MKRFLKRIAILPSQTGVALVKIYQYCISPLYVPSCRFQPTCSEYAREALAKRGLIYGAFLILKRLARCHPFCKGGWDPVPPANSGKCSSQRIETAWKTTDI